MFDVMETLVTEPFFTAVPQFFGMTLDELLVAKHPTSWIDFEEGRITESEYFNRFFHDGRPVDGDKLKRCMRQAYGWIDGMEELLADTRSAGYEIHAFSNYSIWYQLIDEALNLSRYLSWTFVSCATGVRKPDPRAYLGVEKALGVTPTECLFIDDRTENVEAAIRIGMDVILKVDSAQVRKELATKRIFEN